MGYYDPLIAIWPTVPGATTDAKLTNLNAMTVAGPDKNVPVPDVVMYLRNSGLWTGIRMSAKTYEAQTTGNSPPNSPPNPANGSRGASQVVNFNSDMRQAAIDVMQTVAQSALADLVAFGLINATDKSNIENLRKTTVPWWKANGYPAPITGQDLVLAGLQAPPP